MTNPTECSIKHSEAVKQFRTELMHLTLPRRPDPCLCEMFPHSTPQAFPLAFLNLDRSSPVHSHATTPPYSSRSIHDDLSALRGFLATHVVPRVSFLIQHHSSAVLISPDHSHITVYQSFVNADDHDHDVASCDDLALYRSCTVPASVACVPANARDSIPTFITALQRSSIDNTYVQARKGPKPGATNDELREPERDFVVHHFLLPSLAATVPNDQTAPQNFVTVTKKFPTDEFYRSENCVWRRDRLWDVIRSIFHHQLLVDNQDRGTVTYKCFILDLLTSKLHHCNTNADDYPPDDELIVQLAAKIARRSAKLEKLIVDTTNSTLARCVLGDAAAACTEHERLCDHASDYRTRDTPLLDLQSLVVDATNPEHTEHRLETSLTFAPPAMAENCDDSDNGNALPPVPSTSRLTFNMDAVSDDTLVEVVAECTQLLSNKTNPTTELLALTQVQRFTLDVLWPATVDTLTWTLETSTALLSLYDSLAEFAYPLGLKRDPQVQSMRVLSSIACVLMIDRLVTRTSSLAKSYAPPYDILPALRVLLLASHADRRAVASFEAYLLQRAHSVTSKQGIFDVCSGSLADVCVQQSPELLERIKEVRTSEKLCESQKLRELKSSKSLISLYTAQRQSLDPCTCDILTRCNQCKERRNLTRRIDEMTIVKYERLLPTAATQAHVVAFELWMPPIYRSLMNAWSSLVCQFAEPKPHESLAPSSNRWRGNPGSWCQEGLPTSATSCSLDRVVLHTTAKAITLCHYRSVQVQAASQDSVLCGAARNTVFVTRSDKHLTTFCTPLIRFIAALCCVPLSSPYHSLSDAVDPVTSITENRATCERSRHLLLERDEAEAFTSLRSDGGNLNWRRLLTELTASHRLRFEKHGVAQLILQTVQQTGPPMNPHRRHCSVLRQWEADLCEMGVVESVSQVTLTDFLDKIHKNWLNLRSLISVVRIASHLLIVTHDPSPTTTVALLARCRLIAADWYAKVSLVLSKLHKPDERIGYERILVGILCCQVLTFGYDSAILERHSSATDQHDSLFTLLEALRRLRSLVPILCSKLPNADEWIDVSGKELCALYANAFRVAHMHTEQIHQRLQDCPALPMLILTQDDAWPGAAERSAEAFHRYPSDSDGNWYFTRVAQLDVEGNAALVQYNPISGELLVDGAPLGRLPEGITSSSTFKRLFGSRIFENVVALGHLYQTGSWDFCLCDFNGANIYVAHRDTNKVRRVLVSQTLFTKVLPWTLQHEYTHWLKASDTLELHPYRHDDMADDSFASPCYTGALNESVLTLRTTLRADNCDAGQFIVSRQSTLFQRLHNTVFGRIESSDFVHVLLPYNGLLNVILPRVSLSFTVCLANATIRSLQYANFAVAPQQSIGTLLGIHNVLVLEQSPNELASRRRLVLTPYQLQWSASTDSDLHVVFAESTTTKDSVRVLDYSVNDELQRLDAPSLLHRLHLAYLHALSSRTLRDPFTGRTGLECALAWLDQSRSNVPYDCEKLGSLSVIALLSPKRVPHVDFSKKYETTTWRKRLDSLSASDALFLRVYLMIEESLQLCALHHDDGSGGIDSERVKEHLRGARRLDFATRSYWRWHSFYPSSARLTHDEESRLAEKTIARCKGKLGPDLSRRGLASLATAAFVEPRSTVERMRIAAREKIQTKSNITQSCTDKSSLCRMLNTKMETWEKQDISVASLMRFALEDINDDNRRTFVHVLCYLVALDDINSDVALGVLCLSYKPAVSPSFNSWPDEIQAKLSACDIMNSAVSIVQQQPAWKAAEIPTYTLARSERQLAREESLRSAFSNSDWRKPTWNSKSKPVVYNLPRGAHNEIEALDTLWRNQRNRRLFDRWVKRVLQLVSSTSAAPAFSTIKRVPFSSSNTSVPIDFETQLIAPLSVWSEISSRAETIVSTGVWEEFEEAFSRCVRQVGVVKDFQAHPDGELLYGGDEPATQRLLKLLDESNAALQKDALPKRRVWQTDEQTAALLHKVWHMARKLCREHWGVLVSSLKGVQNKGAAASGLYPPLVPETVLPFVLDDNNAQHSLPLFEHAAAVCVFMSYQQKARRLLGSSMTSDQKCDDVMEHRRSQEWSVRDYPSWLLFEVQQSLVIRRNQVLVAKRQLDTEHGRNEAVQQNMGEGKTSVVTPMVCLALSANSECVPRVTILRALFRTNFDDLASRLTGLVARRLFTFPCHRTIELNLKTILKILEQLRECQLSGGGVVMAQWEHTLSLRLKLCEFMSAAEPCKSDQHRSETALLEVMEFVDAHVWDIVDECDQVLNGVKTQLLYTMGNQTALNGGNRRWKMVQAVMHALQWCAPDFAATYGPERVHLEGARDNTPQSSTTGFNGEWHSVRLIDDSLEVYADFCGRIIERLFASEVVANHDIIWIADLDDDKRALLRRVLRPARDESPEATDSDDVEALSQLGLPMTRQFDVLTLRGLLAFGVLGHVLGKRSNVDYGVIDVRFAQQNKMERRRKIAVPFVSMGIPSLRSEYGHPDVALVGTHIAYYERGLDYDGVVQALQVLTVFDKDHSERIYKSWYDSLTAVNEDVPTSASGINLQDATQRLALCKHFRKCMPLIDYWLHHCVLADETKQFPLKMCASASDLAGDVDVSDVQADDGSSLARHGRRFPVRGFSGTNDAQLLFPVQFQQKDLSELQHTNALVVHHLLQAPVISLAASFDGESVSREILKRMLALEPQRASVLIDGGALMSDLSAQEVARAWIEMEKRATRASTIEGVVFYSDVDERMIVDRNGTIVELRYSPLQEALRNGRCGVYLDDHHTRGVDFKLCEGTHAVVTVGPRMHKDKLVQAAMRMRLLGAGHSVTLLLAYEVEVLVMKHREQLKCPSPGGDALRLTSRDVLSWTLCNAASECCAQMSLWATLSFDFARRHAVVRCGQLTHEYRSLAGKAGTSDEVTDLESMYANGLQRLNGRSVIEAKCQRMRVSDGDEESAVQQLFQAILKRQKEHALAQLPEDFTVLGRELDEQQERELQREEEEEHQTEVGAPVEARLPTRSKLLEQIATGDRLALHAFCMHECTSQRDGALLRTSIQQCVVFPTEWFWSHEFGRVTMSDIIQLDEYLRTPAHVLMEWDLVRASVVRVVFVAAHEADTLVQGLRKCPADCCLTLHSLVARVHGNQRSVCMERALVVPYGSKVARRAAGNGSEMRTLVNRCHLFAGSLQLEGEEEASAAEVQGLLKDALGVLGCGDAAEFEEDHRQKWLRNLIEMRHARLMTDSTAVGRFVSLADIQ